MNHRGGILQEPSIAERVVRLQSTYVAVLGEYFDVLAFRDDDFYACQVLDRAISTGSPQLVELAQMMQQTVMERMDGVQSAVLVTEPAPVRVYAAGSIGVHIPAPVSAEFAAASAAAVAAAEADERRELGTPSSGHVRLSGREVALVSRMRNLYRKTFGVFFDAYEFTGNDLYARTILQQCMRGDNADLAGVASEFIGADGRPRFHRRLGRADLELEVSLA